MRRAWEHFEGNRRAQALALAAGGLMLVLFVMLLLGEDPSGTAEVRDESPTGTGVAATPEESPAAVAASPATQAPQGMRSENPGDAGVATHPTRWGLTDVPDPKPTGDLRPKRGEVPAAWHPVIRALEHSYAVMKKCHQNLFNRNFVCPQLPEGVRVGYNDGPGNMQLHGRAADGVTLLLTSSKGGFCRSTSREPTNCHQW